MKTWSGTTKMNLKLIVHIQNDYDSTKVVLNWGIIKHAPIKFMSTHWVCMSGFKKYIQGGSQMCKRKERNGNPLFLKLKIKWWHISKLIQK
jgi:hypothetical protein